MIPPKEISTYLRFRRKHLSNNVLRKLFDQFEGQRWRKITLDGQSGFGRNAKHYSFYCFATIDKVVITTGRINA